MSVKTGRTAVYIEGHAESLVAAAGEGSEAMDKLGLSAERSGEKVAVSGKGFASYSSQTAKATTVTEASTVANDEHAESSSRVTSGLKGAAVGMGGFIAAFAGVEAIKSGAEYTEELTHQTRLLESATGLDSKAASQWIELAKQRQISASKLQIGFASLSKQIRGAETGTSTAAKGFHALGIPMDELRKMSTEEVLFKVSNGLAGMTNHAEKAALTQQFFGKSGRELLPVLEMGEKGLKGQLDQFTGLTEKQEEQGEKVAELERKVSRAYDQIRLDVTFALLSAGEATASWIQETMHGEGVVGRFGATAVKAFEEVEKGQGKVGGFIHQVVEDGKEAANWIEKASVAVGGFAMEVFHGKGGEAGSIIRTVATDLKDVDLWVGKALLTWVKFEGGLVSGAIKAAPGVVNAVVGAVKSAGHWISTAGHNVSQFVKEFIPFKVGLIAVKIAIAPLVLAIMGTIKVIGILSPALKAAAQILKTVIVASLHVASAAIQTFLKVVGDIGSVLGDVVGLVSNLLRGHWGNAWNDAKAIVVDSLHTIEDLIKGVWTTIKAAFSGGMSVIKSSVKHGFSAIEDIFGNVEDALGGAFGSTWDTIKNTFADGTNTVIGFLDTLASVIELIPGVPDIQIPKISVGGGGTNRGTTTAGKGHESGAGYATGGFINRPMYMVGEEAPQHPEWVIATNPAYRENNIGYWVQAGHDLGVPGFALGGLTEDIGSAASSAFGAAKGVASGVINSAKVAIGDLPTPHFPKWLGDLGGYIVDHVSNWITSGFSSGKLGEHETNIAGGLSGSRFKIGAEELKRISAPNVISLALFEALVDEGGPDSNVLEGEGAGTGAPIMSAAREISGFLTGSPTWTGTSAMSLANSGEAAYEIAQDVQASGAGKASHGLANYGSHQHEAESLLKQYGVPGFARGGSPQLHGPPLFRGEGPPLYAAALRHNQPWATHQAPWSTHLNKREEAAFLSWGKNIDGKGHGFSWFGFDPTRTANDYDMRGFWKQTGGTGPAANGHFTDTFKTPYDTTFSNESKYAVKGTPYVWSKDWKWLYDRRTGQEIISGKYAEGGSPTRAIAWARNNMGTNQGSAKQLKWAGESGLGDEGPWCASFVSADMAAQGVPLPPNPNDTHSYEDEWTGGEVVGSSLADARPGDLLGFSGEHIGIYVGGGKMISGNWGDTVAEADVSEDSHPLSAVMRPNYPNGGASTSSLSSGKEKPPPPATAKQKHRIEFLVSQGANVLKEAQGLSHQYKKHGGTAAGHTAIKRAIKFAHQASVAHKAGNSEHAKELIEKSETEIEKARGALGTAGKNVYTAGLKSSPIGEAAKALPKSFRELLKEPGITPAQKMTIAEEASSAAGETEGEGDDKAAAHYQLGLLKKDKQGAQKRLKEIAKALKKGGLTKAQRNHLLNEQTALASQVSSDDSGIHGAQATLHHQPETEEEGEEEEPPWVREQIEATERNTEAVEKKAEEEAERQANIEANQEAILALQKEGVEAEQRKINLLEGQSGPTGAIAGAIAAVVSGQIGGKVGLGYQTPGVAGKVADY